MASNVINPADAKTYDVFREENRAGGFNQWIGQVRACGEADAQTLAESTFGCRETERLWVEEHNDD